jgi:hypothetical protein
MPLLPAPVEGELTEAVAIASRRVAGRLFARYVPLYAAVVVLLVVAATLPSRVARDGAAPAPAAVTASPPPSAVAAPVAPSGTGATVPSNMPMPSTRPPTLPTGGSLGAPPSAPTSPQPDAGDADGFNDDVPPCPIEIGEDPVISRGVAAALLGAASPALSVLGPFGPNAVPALGVVSPVLPVIAPVADAFAPYIRTMNPLFLQISGFGTSLWDGPLQPLEAPLLEVNAAFVQPFEVELLAALAEPVDQVNATPVSPCLQRVLYNVVAPLPIPPPPDAPVPSP